MSEKVIVTKEQDEAIKALKEVWDGTPAKRRNKILIREKILDDHEWKTERFVEANDIPDEDFIAALHYGYEVEQPNFEVNDWVVYTYSDGEERIGKIIAIETGNALVTDASSRISGAIVSFKDSFRHATNDEILWEKMRRNDNKLDEILLDLTDEERFRLGEKLRCGE